MTATTIAVTAEEFTETVLRNDKPVLVDFWAAWCGPCRAIAPVLDEIATELSDRLVVVKVNVEEHRDLAERYAITSIPTLKLFRDGEQIHEFVGAAPKHVLVEELSAHL